MAGSGGFAISISAVDSTSKTIAQINKGLQSLVKISAQTGASSKALADVNMSRLTEGMRGFGDATLAAARGIERISPQMGLLTGAVTLGGMAAMTAELGKAARQAGNLAYSLNMPVEKISQLEVSASIKGIDQSAVDSSLKGLNDKIHAAFYGGPGSAEAQAALTQAGIPWKDATGNIESLTDAFMRLSDKVREQKDPHAQELMERLVGVMPELNPLLKDGRKALQGFMDEASRTGATWSPEEVKNLTIFDAGLNKLGQDFKGVAKNIATDFLPWMTKAEESISKFIEGHPTFSKGAAEAGLLGSLWGSMKAAGAVLGRFGMTGVSSALSAGEGIAATLAPLLFTGAAGGYDAVFDKKKNDEFLRDHPRAGPRASAGPLDTQTTARANLVHDRLMAAGIPGMNDNLAWGFAGNSVQESNANPNGPAGDMGAAHGLMMWRDDRAKNFVKRYGHLPEQGTLDEAVDFMKWELANTEADNWKKIRAAGSGSPGEAGAAVSDFYERPKDTTAEEQRRWELSQRLAGAVHVSVDVKHNGTSAVANSTASGAATTAPPRVEGPMYGAGPTYFP